MQTSISASSQDLTAKGIAAMRAGDTARARTLLCDALLIDQTDELAWLWLSGAVATDAERRYCLERVLALNPGHAGARRGLELLPPTPAAVSPFPVSPPASPMPEIAMRATAPGPFFEPTAMPQAASTSAEEPAPASLLDIISAPAYAATDSSQPRAAGVQVDPILALLSTSTLPTSFSSDVRVPQRVGGDSAPDQASPAGAPPPAVRLNQDIIKFVIQRLGRHTPREDVIRELTRSRCIAWADAHRLVAEVERKHVRSIAFRQGPFYTFLSLVSIVGGLGLTILGALNLYLMLVHPSPMLLRNLYFAGGALLTGLAMLGGGVLGIWQLIRAILFNR